MNFLKKAAILALVAGFSGAFAAEEGEVIAEYGAITVKMLNGKRTALLSGESKETVAIPEDVVIDSIDYDRDYSGEWGKPGTLILPFAFPNGCLSQFGQIYEMTSISISGNKTWQIDTKNMGSNGNFEPNRPYFVRPNAARMVFPKWCAGDNTTMYKTSGVNTTITFDNWEFTGMYSYKQWLDGDPDLGYVYGFAAREKEVDGKTIQQGQFVKGKSGVYIRPFRAFLRYNSGAKALAKSADSTGTASIPADSLPSTIDVIFHDEDGETTAIHSLDPRTGEFTVNKTGWYDMKGRKLQKKPAVKGNYFYNGQKVTIK